MIATILPYAQIVLSVILVTAILLQQSGSSTGGALGGGDGSTYRHTRRGFEYFLFVLSIICGILFTLSAFFAIIIKARS